MIWLDQSPLFPCLISIIREKIIWFHTVSGSLLWGHYVPQCVIRNCVSVSDTVPENNQTPLGGVTLSNWYIASVTLCQRSIRFHCVESHSVIGTLHQSHFVRESSDSTGWSHTQYLVHCISHTLSENHQIPLGGVTLSNWYIASVTLCQRSIRFHWVESHSVLGTLHQSHFVRESSDSTRWNHTQYLVHCISHTLSEKHQNPQGGQTLSSQSQFLVRCINEDSLHSAGAPIH